MVPARRRIVSMIVVMWFAALLSPSEGQAGESARVTPRERKYCASVPMLSIKRLPKAWTKDEYGIRFTKGSLAFNFQPGKSKISFTFKPKITMTHGLTVVIFDDHGHRAGPATVWLRCNFPVSLRYYYKYQLLADKLKSNSWFQVTGKSAGSTGKLRKGKTYKCEIDGRHGNARVRDFVAFPCFGHECYSKSEIWKLYRRACYSWELWFNVCSYTGWCAFNSAGPP